MILICYPKCSTCKKAEEWLKNRGIGYTYRDIKTDRPQERELRKWQEQSGLPLKRFFNTSGLLYKSMNLKEKLPSMTMEEQIALLATDGMLVKRPILVHEDRVLVGFREPEWEELLQEK